MTSPSDGGPRRPPSAAGTDAETVRSAKLLFAKSKVYVHPTRSERDNVAGFIAIFQKESAATSGSESSLSSPSTASLLLGWVPEAGLGDALSFYVDVDMSDAESPPRRSRLVEVPAAKTVSVAGGAFAVPLDSVFSLQLRPPRPGWFHGSVIVNPRVGAALPPLFFHDAECGSTTNQKRRRTRESFDPFGESGEVFWGGLEVLRWVKRHAAVERSAVEPTIYLVNATPEDSRAFGVGATTTAAAAATTPPITGQGQGPAGPSDPPPAAAPAADPLMRLLREAGWNVMERFSRVTTFTRRAAEEALENPNIPPQMRRLIRNPEVQTVQDEFESARVYLARWALGLQEQSERERQRERGRRPWAMSDIHELVSAEEDDEVAGGGAMVMLAERRRPVMLAEWRTWFDPVSGALAVTPDQVKERVFHGGLDAEDGVRAEAWLFLLGVHDWDSSADERRARLASLRDHYYRLKGAWWNRLEGLGGDTDEGAEWREQRSRIEKDVHRTDRNVAPFAGDTVPHPDPDSPFAEAGTNAHLEQLKEMLLTYNELNTSLGYVQGMSDLLSPLYAVLQDDAAAFWAFARFMGDGHHMARNFVRSQSGMRDQLQTMEQLVRFMDPPLYRHLESAGSTNFFFMFRMIIVWFKREFGFTDVLRLWEALWTDHLSGSFHLFIALAILERHRVVMMDHLRAFDEVLKYVNELSGTMDLGEVLIRAESLFGRFRRLVEAVDRKDRIRGEGGRARGARAADSAAGYDDVASRIVTPQLRVLLSRRAPGGEDVEEEEGGKGVQGDKEATK